MENEGNLFRILEREGLIGVKQQKKRSGYMETKEEISKFMWSNAEIVIKEDGEHEPMAFYFGKEELTTLFLGKLFMNNKGKEFAEHIVRSVSKEFKPVVFVFVCGVWGKTVRTSSLEELKKIEEEIEKNGLSHAKDKIEYLMITIETTEETAVEVSEIKRGRDGKVLDVIRIEEMDQYRLESGRFCNIVKPAGIVN